MHTQVVSLHQFAPMASTSPPPPGAFGARVSCGVPPRALCISRIAPTSTVTSLAAPMFYISSRTPSIPHSNHCLQISHQRRTSGCSKLRALKRRQIWICSSALSARSSASFALPRCVRDCARARGCLCLDERVFWVCAPQFCL